MKFASVAIVLAAVTAILGTEAMGQTAASPAATSPAAGAQPASAAADPAAQARGQSIFNTRCKDCHEPAVEFAPSREQLAAKAPADIVAALTTGPMQPMAEGLSDGDKQAIAAYLTAH